MFVNVSNILFYSHNYSGSLLMHATTRGQTPTILLYLVSVRKVYHFWHYHYEYVFFYSTKKILGLSTISRSGHVVAQTRELACTKVVVPEVISRG